MTRARDVADKNLAVISAGNSGQILTSDGTNWSAQNAGLTELSEDTTPALGGDLTMGSNSIADGVLGIKNTGSQSELRLYCEVGNAHYVALKAPAHSAFSGNHSITLPPNDGNTDQFLKTDGNGVTTWSDIPASGGAWTYISEVVSTSSTTVDFSNVFTTTYDNYRIVANNVGSNTTNIHFTASIELSNNIGSYQAYQYFIRVDPNQTPVWSYGGGNEFSRNQNNTGSVAQRANFVADIYNPRSSNAKGVNFYGTGLCGFGNISFAYINSALQFNSPTTEQTGIRFAASSGTLTGTFRLYGFAKS